MDSREKALSMVEQELAGRGWSSRRTRGPIEASHPGRPQRKIIVRSLQRRNGIFLKKDYVRRSDIVVIIQIDEAKIWVLSQIDALRLCQEYESDFQARNGHPPGEEGFNASDLPSPTGWQPLNQLL